MVNDIEFNLRDDPSKCYTILGYVSDVESFTDRYSPASVSTTVKAVCLNKRNGSLEAIDIRSLVLCNHFLQGVNSGY